MIGSHHIEDIENFLAKYGRRDPNVFPFHTRDNRRVFLKYSQDGNPTTQEVCYLLLRGWENRPRLIDGGALPDINTIYGGSDGGWYAVGVPLKWNEGYTEFWLTAALNGFVAKMRQLQREERSRFMNNKRYRHIAWLDRLQATLRKKCAAFIAA